MLTPLQHRVRQIVASVPGAEDLVLAGGAALILQGIVDRLTLDLDFFATSPEEVDRLLPRVERALRDEGLAVERVQVAEGFARLVVSSDEERTTVDLAWDARLFPPERTPEGPVLAEDELAADKMLALFGRAAARDFVDVSVLASRHGLQRLCQLAAEKDPGFDRLILADMLARMERLPRADFDLDDPEYEQLREAVQRWRQELAGLQREDQD